MENFKGTKGNWEYIGRKIGVNFEDAMETVMIADLFGSGEEKTANAKLIAAAPDLLGALQEFVESIRNEDIILQNNTDDECVDYSLKKFELALKKALK